MTYKPSSLSGKVVIKPGLQFMQPFFALNGVRKGFVIEFNVTYNINGE